MMYFKNTKQGYGVVTIFIHWLMAIVIVGLFGLGLWMTDLTYYDEWYRKGPFIHKSVGVLLAIVLLFRLVWRWTNIKPPLPASVSKIEILMSNAVHIALYILMLLIILSGYLISTADGREIEVFNWFSIPALPMSIENQEDIAGDIHFYLASTLIAFAVLHGLAAMKHHFIDGDSTLIRMINPNR